MRILIVHGWGQSADRYQRLSGFLTQHNFDVLLHEFPGFGDTPPIHETDLIPRYSQALLDKIDHYKPDVIIAHEMGGNIILRLLSKLSLHTQIILLSPAYNGIPVNKSLANKKSLSRFLFTHLIKNNDKVLNHFLKPMVNDTKCIDSLMVEDIKRMNPDVGMQTLYELTFDDWKLVGQYSNDITMILGEKDKIVTKKKLNDMLSHLANCKVIVIPKIGSTAVVEDFDKLTNYIIESID